MLLEVFSLAIRCWHMRAIIRLSLNYLSSTILKLGLKKESEKLMHQANPNFVPEKLGFIKNMYKLCKFSSLNIYYLPLHNTFFC